MSPLPSLISPLCRGYVFLRLALFILRTILARTPAGCLMKRKRIPSTIALYFTAPVDRPSSIAASRADFLSFAKARNFLRSADVHGALCFCVDLAIEQTPKIVMVECTNS
jgi:hypothetical protein